MQEAPRLSHVGLYVRDVPKMIDFYTSVLGASEKLRMAMRVWPSR